MRARLRSLRPLGAGEPGWWQGWKPSRDDRPDLVLDEPMQSGLVLEIKCQELIASDQYPSFVTLRFPRCHRVRHDKDPADATTLEEYLSLHTRPSGLRAKEATVIMLFLI